MQTTDKKNQNQYRQGDVFIERIDSLPETGLSKVPPQGGVLIIAHGTATGHNHAIKSDGNTLYSMEGSATAQNPGGMNFLSVETGAELTHDEHAPITLAAGLYKIVRQREYSPEAIRIVAD